MTISLKKLLIAAGAAVLAAVLIFSAYRSLRPESYATVAFHMDTYISYYIGGRHPQETVEAMDARVLRCEEMFSRFDGNSEIALINSSAGGFAEVSEETYLLVKEAVKYADATGGSFDPTVGVLTDLWGFGGEPRVPDSAEIEAAMPYVGYGGISFREEGGHFFVRVSQGQKLDLGGIAKGYALREIAGEAEAAGCRFAVISFGGNVLLCGSGHDGSDGFSVGIRAPEQDIASTALILSLDAGVISTSGSYERFFEENGVRYCHIIDPFTGMCAEGGLLSVSVICDDPVEADCLSTAYFVKGLDSTLDALAGGEITGIAIDGDGTVYISEDLAGRVVRDSVADGYRIEVVG